MKIKALCLALACAALLPFIPAGLSAGAPLKIGFQGRLDESGLPAEGSKTFVFKLYDAVSGGNLVWTGDSQPVALANGAFNATLAAGAPALSTAAFAGARYIEITVDGVPLSPRQEMVSAPYALVAQALAPDAVLPPAPLLAASVTDYHVLLSTAAIGSGKFGDDRVLITTGAFTGGFNGNSQLVQLDGAGKLPASALTEADPIFVVSVSSLIVSGDITNWNAAYGWGSHASAGYETAAAHSASLANYAALAATQAFTGANTFTSSAAFTSQHATDPGVRVSSGLVVAAGYVGINTTAPNSVLTVNGAISLPIKLISDDYVISDRDSTILIDPSTNPTITLPSVEGIAGRTYFFRQIGNAGAAILESAVPELIEGGADITLNACVGIGDETLSVQTDGVAWYVVSFSCYPA